MDRISKNIKIKESIKSTRLKRRSQSCKTYRFKVDKSSLNRAQKESLKMFFVEAKRVYNYLLSEINSGKDLYSYDYKNLKDIKYLDKDKNEVDYHVNYIGSSVIANTIELMKDSIKGLSVLKKHGLKVGGLRFKSECNSINLRQYGITHKIKGSKFKIQGIKKPIRVCGLNQVPDNADLTTAKLLYDGNDYYISLTCFTGKTVPQRNDKTIGIDLGCSNTITTSDGEKLKVSIEESERLKGLQTKLSKQTKRSNNWYKTRSKIRKEYCRMNNKKDDIANKIVHKLTQNGTVVIQDDQISEWKENKTLSKTIQHSVIGRIKTKLKRKDNVVALDQWFPTSKQCSCGARVDLKLSDRTFKCPVCGAVEDRDVHAAKNMIVFYEKYKSAGSVDSMPRKTITYKKFLSVMSGQEARLALAAGQITICKNK